MIVHRGNRDAHDLGYLGAGELIVPAEMRDFSGFWRESVDSVAEGGGELLARVLLVDWGSRGPLGEWGVFGGVAFVGEDHAVVPKEVEGVAADGGVQVRLECGFDVDLRSAFPEGDEHIVHDVGAKFTGAHEAGGEAGQWGSVLTIQDFEGAGVSVVELGEERVTVVGRDEIGSAHGDNFGGGPDQREEIFEDGAECAVGCCVRWGKSLVAR